MTAGTGIRHWEKNDHPKALQYRTRHSRTCTSPAARLTAAGERRLDAVEPSEVLIWEMHASLRPAAG
jgi:hypothetical protein